MANPSALYDFESPHESAFSFAQQCYRLGLATSLPVFVSERFLNDAAVSTYLLEGITDTAMTQKQFVFDFDRNKKEHVKWAVLALEIGFFAT